MCRWQFHMQTFGQVLDGIFVMAIQYGWQLKNLCTYVRSFGAVPITNLQTVFNDKWDRFTSGRADLQRCFFADEKL
jgi:hypothetical protein